MKSVGLISTRAPFDNFHSVTPISGIVRSCTTFPGVGAAAMSGASVIVSAYGLSLAFVDAEKAARISCSVGAFTPAFAGDCATMTRLSSVIHLAAALFTSASVIVGRIFCVSGHVYSIASGVDPNKNALIYEPT